MSFKTQVLNHLSAKPEGVTDTELMGHFGAAAMKDNVLPVLNQLMQVNRLKSVQLETGGILFQLVEEQTAEKLQGLSPETMMVYLEIEGGGTDGISTMDIKRRANIQQNTLTKATKELERRLIIKRVKSIHHKTQKIWMLYDLMPSTHITGGPWYTDNEFDHEFVAEISDALETFIREEWFNKNRPSSLQKVETWVSTSGITEESLSTEHIKQILGRLTFDSKIETYNMREDVMRQQEDRGPFYRPTMPLDAVMRVIGVDGSVISPCMNYLSLWADWHDVDQGAATDAMDEPNPFNGKVAVKAEGGDMVEG